MIRVVPKSADLQNGGRSANEKWARKILVFQALLGKSYNSAENCLDSPKVA